MLKVLQVKIQRTYKLQIQKVKIRSVRSIRRIFYWSGSIDQENFRSIRSHKLAKISKHKKPKTCPFKTQIAIPFFPIFKGYYKLTLEVVYRERRVHLVPLMVDLGFLYPKLSQVIYWQYFLKNLKIRCCKSCCYKINYWWQSLEGDLKVTNVGICVKQIKDRKVHGFKAARGRISKFYKR